MERTMYKNKLTVRKAIRIAMSTLGYEKIKLKDIYSTVVKLRGETPEEQIRSVIYRNKEFIPTDEKGVWTFNSGNAKGLLIQDNGRKMKGIQDNSIDALICDSPWLANASHKSGNYKNMAADYEDTCFNYIKEDFVQKARVLKNNGILVEFMPEMQGDNYPIHMNLLKLAEETGFKLYTTIGYLREGESINTGKKQKGTGTLYIFTKGDPPLIRPNNKIIKNKVYFPIANHNPFATYETVLDEILAFGKEDFSDEFLSTKLEKTESSWKKFSSLLAKTIKDINTDVVFKSKYCMRGLRYMLPAIYAVKKEIKEHQAQKPKELLKQLSHAVSLPNQTIVDSFGGSGIIAKAIGELKESRKIIIYEILDKYIYGNNDTVGMIERFNATKYQYYLI